MENDINDKTRFLRILRETERPGVENLIEHLESSGFFGLSCHKHHRESGGLVKHSLEVYDAACSIRNESVPIECIAIVSLLHDLGNIREQGGHGSVNILEEWGFQLTPAEMRAIKYHMWKAHSPEEEKEFEIAKGEELWRTLVACDCFSAGSYKFEKIALIIKQCLPVYDLVKRLLKNKALQF